MDPYPSGLNQYCSFAHFFDPQNAFLHGDKAFHFVIHYRCWRTEEVLYAGDIDEESDGSLESDEEDSSLEDEDAESEGDEDGDDEEDSSLENEEGEGGEDAMDVELIPFVKAEVESGSQQVSGNDAESEAYDSLLAFPGDLVFQPPTEEEIEQETLRQEQAAKQKAELDEKKKADISHQLKLREEAKHRHMLLKAELIRSSSPLHYAPMEDLPGMPDRINFLSLMLCVYLVLK